MEQQKIIVAGSRDFNDKAFVYRQLDKYLDFLFEIGKNQVILNGGARGIDYLARQYANDNDIDCQTFYANWDEYGKQAGAIRNNEMADNASILIAFYNGSRGTKNMIETASRKGLEVHIIPIPKTEIKDKGYKKNKNYTTKGDK